MRLKDWVDRYDAEHGGSGGIAFLKKRTKLSYTTVHAIVHGNATPKYGSAKKLHEATDRQVSVAEICEPDESPPPAKRKRAASSNGEARR